MKNIFFIIFIVSGLFAEGQVSVVKTKLDAISIQADSFSGYDKFGFAYFITDNTLVKRKDSIEVEYKNLSFGKIAKVDLKNPLKIALFYESFNTVVLLDNQLNEIQRIEFSKIDFPKNNIAIVAAAAGNADQNRLWIYNSLTQQIALFDYLAKDYKTITTPSVGNLKYYESDLNYFQWIDENYNRFACDVYGKVSALGKVPEYDRIRFVNEKWLFYSKAGQLFSYDIKNSKASRVDIDEKSFVSFYATPQILSIFTTTGITNYKIFLP